MSEEIWTIERILNWTKDYFKSKEISTARLDAEVLLSHACHCKRIDLYLNADLPLNSEERACFRVLVRKRVQGVPVAYLTKKKEFYSLSLKVEEGVLIPRPDTEILVEQSVLQIRAWQKANPDSPCTIAELGTGTAAIPLALCSELENLSIQSVDTSSVALRVANENLKLHAELLTPKNNHIDLIQGEFLNMFSSNSFDFILSNPPYISTPDIDTLQQEVREHEPRLALDGGKSGLDFYVYLNQKAPSLLKTHGSMLLEIGSDQAESLRKLFSTPLWESCIVQQDFAGLDRVLLLNSTVVSSMVS